MRYIVSIFLFILAIQGDSYAQKTGTTPASEPNTLVKFYPNPAANFITFEIKAPVERGTSLQVYSFLGRQVATVPVTSQRITVNVSDYFRGVYVFQVRASNGKVLETNKFQVSR